MSKRNVQTLSLCIDRFATIKMPMVASCFKNYIQNFPEGTTLQPITVIKTSKVNNPKLKLYDIATGLKIDEKEKNNSWFVIDGTKRLKSLMMLYEETSDNSYMTIDAIIESIINIPDENVIKYMADINFMSKCWTPKDYVDYCYIMFPSDRIFQMSHLLMGLGAPISVVSRLATGASNCFSSKSLVQYINGDDQVMKSFCFCRALELYRLFIEVGFSRDFINKRYLVDFVNKECFISDLQHAIDMIASVDDKTTQLIEASRLGNEDLDIIGTMIRRNYIQCKDKGTEKTYQLDLSIDRFVQNMKDIPRLLA